MSDALDPHADFQNDPLARAALAAALAWGWEAGADEAICEDPQDRFAETVAAEAAARARAEARRAGRGQPAAAPRPAAPRVVEGPTPPQEAEARARAAHDLPALRAALEGFDRCPLRAGARSTVFCDGVPGAPLMIVGEAPGRDEDREGKPFVGRSGHLLDRMLHAVGRARDAENPADAVYITNLSPWRPLENRTPSSDEAAMLLPFLRRHIELAAPKVLLLMGNAPWKALMESDQGITRARGKWTEWRGIPVMPSFHPAFLLRSPARKREAWIDLQQVRDRLKG